MQQRKSPFAALFLMAAFMIAAQDPAQAEQLWKYTDKDGKVTYSDKAPKKGENAQPVAGDSSTNVIDAPKNMRDGVPQKLQNIRERAEEKGRQRDQLQRNLDAANRQLAAAKALLDQGKDPLQEEIQIVVGRTKTGATTGANTQIRKPEYYARVAGLEENVKKAEAEVAVAERNLRVGAP